VFGKAQHHLAAGLRATGLEETEVFLADLRLQGEVELRKPPALSPDADVVTDTQGGMGQGGTHDLQFCPRIAGIPITSHLIVGGPEKWMVGASLARR
jgi:hypothetical protein